MPTKWKKGVYVPINKDKYKGNELPIFRSSWEMRFARFIDIHPDILEWTSEEPLIPYFNPNTGTTWNYHPDFLVKIKDATRQRGFRIELIEIKPKSQTTPPIVTKRKKQATILHEHQAWVMNSAKWVAAKRYCLEHGYIFKILTEEHLFV
jgi:hypothetical protein